MQTVGTRRDKEVLSGVERLAQAALAVVVLLLFGFLVYHQLTNTGFFTVKFGTVEMICLYVPVLLACITPMIRVVTGRKNPARIAQTITDVCLALGSLWLVVVFPFDFTHLADALPGTLRFLLAWTPDEFGKFVLALQIVIGVLTAISTAVRYLWVHHVETIAHPPMHRHHA